VTAFAVAGAVIGVALGAFFLQRKLSKKDEPAEVKTEKKQRGCALLAVDVHAAGALGLLVAIP
jgi:hypothetical protein